MPEETPPPKDPQPSPPVAPGPVSPAGDPATEVEAHETGGHPGHDHHKFDFAALNQSHNQPYSAIEWVHGHPVLIFDLASYADANFARLSDEPGYAKADGDAELGWAQDYVAKQAHIHPAQTQRDPAQLAKAMTLAHEEAPAFPRALSFFNHQTFWSTIALILAALVLLVFARRRADQYKPANRLQHMLEATVLFVRDDIVRPNIAHGDHWTPFFASMLIALLACNLFGLIPFFGSATGNIAVTAGFAAFSAFLMLFMGIKENGPVLFWFKLIPVKWSWKPLDMFVWMLLAVLEWLSLVIRPSVLAIRLFANILAGHTVLLVFLSLGFIIHESNGHIAMAHGLGAVGWIIAVAFYILELLVACIQAYIFTLLSAIFIGQCAHPEH
jgi:F-type H+-transporting ATPase subunit a